MHNRCSIFWDNSNLYAGARTAARAIEGDAIVTSMRLHYESLFELAVANRDVSTAISVASTQGDSTSVGDRLAAIGLQVELFERGSRTLSEQAVDQALQVHMLRCLADETPGVAVLLTGDGAGYTRGAGFLADIERMHRGGWAIEVLSWEHNCNRHLKSWAIRNGLFVPLDDYYDNITYLKGRRRQKPITERRRVLASPGAPPLKIVTA